MIAAESASSAPSSSASALARARSTSARISFVLLRQPPRDPAADAADALDRDAHALGAVGAQPFADRRLAAQIDAARGQRAGVAPRLAARHRPAADRARRFRARAHFGIGLPPLLGGSISSAQQYHPHPTRPAQNGKTP